MSGTCPECGAEVEAHAHAGRPRIYCSSKCGTRARVRKLRRERLPELMISSHRWVRADGKRPIRVNGRSASSTDPTTWVSFKDVKDGGPGDGFGVMLGGGLGCYDLDHVSDETARDFIKWIPEPVVYMERSVSGEGVHVFVEATEGPGAHVMVGGVKAERYTRARFIRTTLDRFSAR